MGMERRVPLIAATLRGLAVVSGAVASTFTFFLVLPLIQAITKPPAADLSVQSIETANVPPPPPPPEKEPEEEPEPEEQPPELAEELAPLDLSQLELALNASFSEGWMGGDFAVKLDTLGARGGDVDDLFSISDLDQKPRVLYQPSPLIGAKERKHAPGTVHVIFIVGQDGRVQSPLVQRSSDSVFDAPALAAVKQWKFEPGKRNGQPVRFRMRVPITFPEG